MNFLLFLLILIAVFGVLAIVYITNYNHMKYLQTKVETSEETIKKYLDERYSYLEDAAAIVKKTVGDDKDYFKDYLIKSSSMIKLHESLINAYDLLYKGENDIKKLQTNKKLATINKKIKLSNEKIVAITEYYNKSITELNEFARNFPSKYVAKINKIKIKPLFNNKTLIKE